MAIDDPHDPYAEAHRRAMDRHARMTREERMDLLHRAGILDENGQLAERYKAGGEPVNGTDSAAKVTR